jgi:hypothetical protein
VVVRYTNKGQSSPNNPQDHQHMLTSKTETRTCRILKGGVSTSRPVETVFVGTVGCWRCLTDFVAKTLEAWPTTSAILRIRMTRLSPTDYARRKVALKVTAAGILGDRFTHQNGNLDDYQWPSPWAKKPCEGRHSEQPHGARLPTSPNVRCARGSEISFQNTGLLSLDYGAEPSLRLPNT